MTERIDSRQSQIGVEHSQIGEFSARDSAGGNIASTTVHGLTGEQLGKLLEQQTEFYMTLVAAYERQASELAGKLQRLRDENDMYREGERAHRTVRQNVLDRRLTRIEYALLTLTVILVILAWRLWPAITAAAVAIAAQL